DISLKINDGEFVAIVGPSGCGKSTLLNVLGLLDVADSGQYFLNGKAVDETSGKERAKLRNQHFGFVFQSFNLLPRTSAFDNVMLPLNYRSAPSKREQVLKILGEVGLSDKIKQAPNQLSGGQQQRVAIARALVGEPEVILADEPTGNLDTKTGLEIMEILKGINQKGKTILFVTHNDELLGYASRVIKMRDGVVVEDNK
ncbi:MAG: ABC transporter ATP-binding protein, partial [Patescibacteria group bacterium]